MRVRLIPVACTLLLAGCANSIHVRTAEAPNFSLSGRTTFRILAVPRRSDGASLGPNDPMLANSITNQTLYRDIKRALESRGYVPAEKRKAADIDVAPYAAAHDALDIQTYNYGYTWGGWPRQYTQVTPYTRGSVVIDLIDPATHQLMWRGQGVSAVSDDPGEYVKELGKVVKAIIKKLPDASS
jgi:hypothetical protein